MNKAEVLNALKTAIAAETGLPPASIADAASFYSLGLDSISAVCVLDDLEKQLRVEINPMYFWDYPTVSLLADHLSTLKTP